MPYRTVNNVIDGVTITFYDITTQKQTEEAVRISEQKYKQLADLLGFGVGYYSVDGKLLYFNEQAIKNLGGKLEDYLGRSIVDIIGGAEGKKYFDRIAESIKTGKSIGI